MSAGKSVWLRFTLAFGLMAVPLHALAAQDRSASGPSMSDSSGQDTPAQTAADNPQVGGAPMYPSKTIVANALASKDHTTLVAALKAAGLVATLDGPGPFTVFAPTNDAFSKLPPGTVESLLQPANKPALVKLLTYHVVAGKLTGSRLRSAIKAGGGIATLTTIEGEPLTISLYDDHIVLTDAKGGFSRITTGNVFQSNGLIHVVDTVLAP